MKCSVIAYGLLIKMGDRNWLKNMALSMHEMWNNQSSYLGADH